MISDPFDFLDGLLDAQPGCAPCESGPGPSTYGEQLPGTAGAKDVQSQPQLLQLPMLMEPAASDVVSDTFNWDVLCGMDSHPPSPTSSLRLSPGPCEPDRPHHHPAPTQPAPPPPAQTTLPPALYPAGLQPSAVPTAPVGAAQCSNPGPSPADTTAATTFNLFAATANNTRPAAAPGSSSLAATTATQGSGTCATSFPGPPAAPLPATSESGATAVSSAGWDANRGYHRSATFFEPAAAAGTVGPAGQAVQLTATSASMFTEDLRPGSPVLRVTFATAGAAPEAAATRGLGRGLSGTSSSCMASNRSLPHSGSGPIAGGASRPALTPTPAQTHFTAAEAVPRAVPAASQVSVCGTGGPPRGLPGVISDSSDGGSAAASALAPPPPPFPPQHQPAGHCGLHLPSQHPDNNVSIHPRDNGSPQHNPPQASHPPPQPPQPQASEPPPAPQSTPGGSATAAQDRAPGHPAHAAPCQASGPAPVVLGPPVRPLERQLSRAAAAVAAAATLGLPPPDLAALGFVLSGPSNSPAEQLVPHHSKPVAGSSPDANPTSIPHNAITSYGTQGVAAATMATGATTPRAMSAVLPPARRRSALSQHPSLPASMPWPRDADGGASTGADASAAMCPLRRSSGTIGGHGGGFEACRCRRAEGGGYGYGPEGNLPALDRFGRGRYHPYMRGRSAADGGALRAPVPEMTSAEATVGVKSKVQAIVQAVVQPAAQAASGVGCVGSQPGCHGDDGGGDGGGGSGGGGFGAAVNSDCDAMAAAGATTQSAARPAAESNAAATTTISGQAGPAHADNTGVGVRTMDVDEGAAQEGWDAKQQPEPQPQLQSAPLGPHAESYSADDVLGARLSSTGDGGSAEGGNVRGAGGGGAVWRDLPLEADDNEADMRVLRSILCCRSSGGSGQAWQWALQEPHHPAGGPLGPADEVTAAAPTRGAAGSGVAEAVRQCMAPGEAGQPASPSWPRQPGDGPAALLPCTPSAVGAGTGYGGLLAGASPTTPMALVADGRNGGGGSWGRVQGGEGGGSGQPANMAIDEAPAPAIAPDSASSGVGSSGESCTIGGVRQHQDSCPAVRQLYDSSAAGDGPAAAARLGAADSGPAAAACVIPLAAPSSQWMRSTPPHLLPDDKTWQLLSLPPSASVSLPPSAPASSPCPCPECRAAAKLQHHPAPQQPFAGPTAAVPPYGMPPSATSHPTATPASYPPHHSYLGASPSPFASAPPSSATNSHIEPQAQPSPSPSAARGFPLRCTLPCCNPASVTSPWAVAPPCPLPCCNPAARPGPTGLSGGTPTAFSPQPPQYLLPYSQPQPQPRYPHLGPSLGAPRLAHPTSPPPPGYTHSACVTQPPAAAQLAPPPSGQPRTGTPHNPHAPLHPRYWPSHHHQQQQQQQPAYHGPSVAGGTDPGQPPPRSTAPAPPAHAPYTAAAPSPLPSGPYDHHANVPEHGHDTRSRVTFTPVAVASAPSGVYGFAVTQPSGAPGLPPQAAVAAPPLQHHPTHGPPAVAAPGCLQGRPPWSAVSHGSMSQHHQSGQRPLEGTSQAAQQGLLLAPYQYQHQYSYPYQYQQQHPGDDRALSAASQGYSVPLRQPPTAAQRQALREHYGGGGCSTPTRHFVSDQTRVGG